MRSTVQGASAYLYGFINNLYGFINNLALRPECTKKRGAPKGELTLRTSVITHGSKGELALRTTFFIWYTRALGPCAQNKKV